MARTHHLLTALLLSSAPAAAWPTAQHAQPDDTKAPRALRDLRAAFFHAGQDTVLADIARFRPLCDQDGYPLVGNLASKGGMYQPSQFCAEVRKREKTS